MFNHDDCISTFRHGSTGSDFRALPRFDLLGRHATGMNRFNALQYACSLAARSERVFCNDCESIHGCAIEWRNIYSSDNVGGEHSSIGVFEWESFGSCKGYGALLYERERLSKRHSIPNWPHVCIVHLETSRTRCPSSERMSLFIASRTAFSEPGIDIRILPRVVPAHARLNMAAAPIS